MNDIYLLIYYMIGFSYKKYMFDITYDMQTTFEFDAILCIDLEGVGFRLKYDILYIEFLKWKILNG